MKPLRETVSTLADAATIGALALAIYAIINPGTVSAYLDKIAQSSARSEQTLVSIGTNTEGTERNTRSMAEAIPDTATFETIYTVQGRNIKTQFFVRNPSPFPLREARLFYGRETSGIFSIPPFQSQEIIVEGHVRHICMEYELHMQDLTARKADKRTYRLSATKQPDPNGYVDTYPGVLEDYQISEGNCASL